MNDQIVELHSPGLQIILYSPLALRELERGGHYATHFPDGRDLVDYMNDCRLCALGTRWPTSDHWLHLSSTMDHGVIARASDHVRLGIEVTSGLLCVRSGDDLFDWPGPCADEQLVSLDNGPYAVTACMLPYGGEGAVRIYLHFAQTPARPDLGYDMVPELYCEEPVF